MLAGQGQLLSDLGNRAPSSLAKYGLGLHSMGSYVHAGGMDTKQRAVSSMARPSKGGFDTMTMSEGKNEGNRARRERTLG